MFRIVSCSNRENEKPGDSIRDPFWVCEVKCDPKSKVVGNLQLGDKKVTASLLQTNITMENGPFEDVFPTYN